MHYCCITFLSPRPFFSLKLRVLHFTHFRFRLTWKTSHDTSVHSYCSIRFWSHFNSCVFGTFSPSFTVVTQRVWNLTRGNVWPTCAPHGRKKKKLIMSFGFSQIVICILKRQHITQFDPNYESVATTSTYK